MRVVTVVVTYNSRSTIERCLDGLLAQTAAISMDVSVLDNASADDTTSVVRTRFPELSLTVNPTNVGFARAVNQAVAAAADQTSTHVLLVNPDAYLAPDAVERLLEAAVHLPSAGALGGLSLSPTGELDATCCLGLPSLRQAVARAVGLHAWPVLRRWDPERIGPLLDREAGPVPAVCGGLLLMPLELWTRLGGLDTAYFLYGEDVDLCARVWRAGRSVELVPSASYVHARGSSSPDPTVYLTRVLAGRTVLYRRQLAPRWRAEVAVAVTVWGVGARHAFAAARGRRSRWSPAWRARRTWSSAAPHTSHVR